MSFETMFEAEPVVAEVNRPKCYKYLKKQDYVLINTIKAAKKEAAIIKKAGRNGVRCVFDSEEDYLDEFGRVMPLVMGTSIKPGRVRVFCLYHPDGRSKHYQVVEGIKEIVADLLHDKHVPKIMHHGVSDCNAARSMYGVSVRGELFDTEYAEFFRNPGRFSYGLKLIANHRFRDFFDYALITMPQAAPRELPESASIKLVTQVKALKKASVAKQYAFYRKLGLLRYGQLTQEQILLYNGADCDITKRIELSTKKDTPLALLKVYVDAAFILNEMEHNGPIFDFTHHEKLCQLYPPKLAYALKKLKRYAGKDFNPGSHPQVKDYIYKTMKLKYPFPLGRKDKPNNTKKGTIEFLARTNKFCKWLMVYRKNSKIVSTYLSSFFGCAVAHNGHLKTKWWLTGTGTGRLSSGGTKGESVDKVVNLQNVHGEPLLQDQLIPDKHWRKMYKYALKYFKRAMGSVIVKKIENGEELDDDEIKKRLKTKLWEKFFEKILSNYGDTKVFLGFDFGQIEVRVVAQLSGDKNLIKDCESGDIHSAVGHAMTGWAVEAIKKDKRTRTLTKNLHFGMLFGLNIDGLYNFIKQKDPDTKITRDDVERMVNRYFARYPGVKRLIAKLRKQAEDKGYVENMFGFRRPLDVGNKDKKDSDEETGRGAYWGNQAINTPVQGAAHHLMLMAVAALKRKCKVYQKLLGTPVMEVHDALYFFVKLKDMLKALAIGKRLLTKEPLEIVKNDFPKVDFKIKLDVDGKLGLRLGDTVEIESDDPAEIFGAMMLETFARECSLERELKLVA